MADFNIGFVQFTQLEEDKRTEKSPDVTGFIEVLATDVDAPINYLQTAEREEDYRGDEVVKLRLAGWNGLGLNSTTACSMHYTVSARLSLRAQGQPMYVCTQPTSPS